MSLHRRIDPPEPVGQPGGPQEIRRVTRSWVMATGTLACPACDAPVAPLDRPMSPPDPILCPVCHHGGRVRDFLSLESPSRPARVQVRVVPSSRARR